MRDTSSHYGRYAQGRRCHETADDLLVSSVGGAKCVCEILSDSEMCDHTD